MNESDEEKLQQPPKLGPVFINPNKKYGLQIKGNLSKPGTNILTANKTTANKQLVKPCIFDQDDDDDDKESVVKKPLISLTTSNRLKKQTQIELEKAISEDAEIFEYDSIYDKLESEKLKLDPKLKNDSKEPKYIAGIMKAAAKRQMDFEKVQEKKIQKEREQEGDLWSDKEVFVTTAYRKKMEERQLLEEEERRQEQIEALLDVRKQKNLSGFYTNVLKMRSGEFVIHEESEKEKFAKAEEALKKKNEANVKSTHSAKIYRTQKEESSEEEEEDKLEVKKEAEICAEDKDEIISDEENERMEAANKSAETIKTDLNDEDNKKLEIKIEIESLKQEQILANQKIDKEQKRINMFKKRTVNEVFDKELSDYFIRKSSVLSLKTYIERD